jgi:hypothetical protein
MKITPRDGPRKPRSAATVTIITGSTTVLQREAAIACPALPFILSNLNPAPRLISASGVARFERCVSVLSAAEGISHPESITATPSRAPIISGFVITFFTVVSIDFPFSL